MTFTYKQLYHRVCQFANGLKRIGVQKGDRVLVYMPMSVEAVITMQACARIGAIHSAVLGGFSAKSVHERIVNGDAKVVVTADEQVRGGKKIPLKTAVDGAGDGMRVGGESRRVPAHRRQSRDGSETRYHLGRPHRRTA
jgi:acetyl-CoA synthetase